MKIEIIKEKLLSVLLRVERLTGKHLSLPILSHVLFTAKKGLVIVRATNLDMGIECSIPAKVEREGTIAVPASVFLSFVSNLGNVKGVLMEEQEKKLIISAGTTSASIHTAPSDEFPTIPKAEGGAITIPPNVFVKGFTAVQYAGALGNLKPELGSVYLYQEGDNLLFAATDSFRLAEKKVPVKKNIFPTGILIPIRNVVEFVKILEEEENDIKITVGKGQLSVETENMFLTSRLVDGTFPDYRQIIPKEFVTEATALKEDVISALKVTTLFSDKFNQLQIRVDPAKKLFEFQTRNGDVGESSFKLSAALTGKELQGNFNHRYIYDCLGALPGDSVHFKWSGENRPLLIQGAEDNMFRYLVMPMNR